MASIVGHDPNKGSFSEVYVKKNSLQVAMHGKTTEIIEDLKPVSVIKDLNDEAVLRVVDAAPFAYDSTNDKLYVDDSNTQSKIDSLINAISNNNYTGKTDSEMPVVVKAKATANLKYIYPLQESNDWIAYDLSTNVYNGRKVNINSVNYDGLNSPRRSAIFRSAADSYVRPPKTCSVRNLAAFTWFGLVNVTTQSSAKKLYSESTGNDSAAGRFQIVLNANSTISVYVRSGTSARSPLTYVSTAAMPTGWHFIFVTVDVATNTIELHYDGSAAKAGTITNSLAPDTKIVDTAPASIIYLGSSNASASYVGNMAYAGIYERVLTLTEMQDLSIAAGTLSLDRA